MVGVQCLERLMAHIFFGPAVSLSGPALRSFGKWQSGVLQSSQDKGISR